ncbi:MAG: hypothetical protein P9X22_00510 [Candidatus Zapsychrus exili]|nr:hypothetical protein [Candidatus Zapsychrus exili]
MQFPFFKEKKSAGQQSIEFTTLIILATIGVLVMGPYVIRSWNANIKGWEDSVRDSFNDPLIESETIPDIPGCDLAITF